MEFKQAAAPPCTDVATTGNLPHRMLRLIPPDPPLDAAERHGLSLLLDCSRLLVAEAGMDAVALRVTPRGGTASLTWLQDAARLIAIHDGEVRLDREALGLVARLGGAVAEQQSDNLDRYGRVPPEDNDAVRASLDGDPVVQRLAVALRRTAVAVAGRRPMLLVAPWPDGHRWALAMTHDLDVVAGWPVFTALRLAELARKGRVGQVARVLLSAATSALRDPVGAAVREVIAVEERFAIRSTWFIIAGTPGWDTWKAGDITYLPESPAARQILDAVRDAGHELGLHGSFATLDAPQLFVEQRDRLAALALRPVHGIRQHFIRMRPGVTHRGMAAAGFQYDSTFGFADRNGFRLGVADVVPVWDQLASRSLAIDEVPFVWMDRALSKYRGVEDPGAWVADALRLGQICRDVEGVWCGIWHPNLATPLGFPGALDAFSRLCAELVADKPWSASLGDIVRWRRARRQVRLVAGPGAPRVSIPATPFTLAIEDADGRPVAHERA